MFSREDQEPLDHCLCEIDMGFLFICTTLLKIPGIFYFFL